MRRTSLALAVLLLVGLAPTTRAHADDPPATEPAEAIDYLGLLARMQDELSYFVGPARWPGHDGALAYIWRVYVQKRSKRAQRFFKELQKPARWLIDEETEWALMLKPESWSPFIQRLAKAYSELAAARDGLKKINVSPRSAIHNWHKRHPEPDLRRRTPAERALLEIRTAIQRLRLRRESVPRWYYVREAELIDLALVERRALEAAHVQWGVDREAAIQAITAAVAETKNAAEIERQRIELFLKNAQTLVADLQVKQEAVLREALLAFPDDAKLAAAAKKDLADMKKGRLAGAAYGTAKSSKWSSLVRQGWMRPHGHLLSALKSAKARAEAAAAEQAAPAVAPGPDGKAPEGKGSEAKPPEGAGEPGSDGG